MTYGMIEGLKGYGNSVAVGKGDNFLSLRVLLKSEPEAPYKKDGLELFNPVTGEVITGFEGSRNGNRLPRHLESRYGNGFPSQPAKLLFDTDGDYHISVSRPQCFPEDMKTGTVKIAIGAGFDILADSSKLKTLHLNGQLSQREKRESVMRTDLGNMGCVGECLGIKPVIFYLISSRGNGNDSNIVKTLNDLKRYGGPVVTEFPHLGRTFFRQKGLDNVDVKHVYGGADDRVISGLEPTGLDLSETGQRLLDYVHDVRMVTYGDGTDPVVILFSYPWLLTTEKTYSKDKPFFDDLFMLTRNNRKILEKYEPALYEEQFGDLHTRFKEKERALVG